MVGWERCEQVFVHSSSSGRKTKHKNKRAFSVKKDPGKDQKLVIELESERVVWWKRIGSGERDIGASWRRSLR